MSLPPPIAGRVVILSGPSGAGKTTVVRELLRSSPVPLVLSVSATTRGPRAGELDGREYHFLSHAEFAGKRAAGEFLECKEVFGQVGTLGD
jgi:guanylate kinase